MIFEVPGPKEPIRQGDIFRNIPRVDLDLGKMLIVRDGNGVAQDDWLSALRQQQEITGLVGIRAVTAIVITQDCDAVRVDDIALCEIAEFKIVEPGAGDPKTAKKMVRFILKQARLNLKWFYLPADETIGFTEKMAVDFHSVIPASRTYLEANLQGLRVARLNAVAVEHFRERLSDYYRRYPYDEWYSLDKTELEAYREDYPDVEPKPWQK